MDIAPRDPQAARGADAAVPVDPAELPTAADAAAIGRLVDEILPLLIARFRAGRMGELEVQRAGWHVRVRRPPDDHTGSGPGSGSASSAAAAGTRSTESGRRARRSGQDGAQATAPTPGTAGLAGSLAPVGPGRPGDGHTAASAAASLVATSPGVGFYTTRDGIATGSQVRSGDVLGHVDVLGVRQEVVSPGDGIVSRLLAEAGEAVEYGQDLVRLESVARTEPVREA